jgi:hypothetical protein
MSTLSNNDDAMDCDDWDGVFDWELETKKILKLIKSIDTLNLKQQHVDNIKDSLEKGR